MVFAVASGGYWAHHNKPKHGKKASGVEGARECEREIEVDRERGRSTQSETDNKTDTKREQNEPSTPKENYCANEKQMTRKKQERRGYK